MGQSASANTPNRVSYSFGMKLSLPAKYESADFHISMSSDVKDDETSEQAYNRIKKEVEDYARLAYTEIRNTEEGLQLEQPKNEGNVGASKEETEPVETKKAAPADPKILRKKIKAAFGVLEAQKKVTKAEFVSKYLFNKKTDDLSELEVTKTIVALRENFPELNL